MPTNFDHLVNKASTTLRVAHAAGDGILKVFDASAFPSSGRVTCYQGTGPLSEQVYAILAYSSVDLTTNTLTITGALEGTTDVNMPARTRVEIRGTAGQWNDLTAAVNALEEAGGGSGSVTSVSLEVPSGLEVSGSPVTDAGTITVSTSLNGIVKGNGSGFEAAVAGTDFLTPSDIASIPATSITGTLPVSHGGTGLTAIGSPDQIMLVKHDGSQIAYKSLVGGNNVTLAIDATSVTVAAQVPTLVAGTNITLTPGTGTVTISAADSGVTSVALSVPSGLSVSGSPVTSTGTLAVTTTLAGLVKGTGTGFGVAVADVDYTTKAYVDTAVAAKGTVTSVDMSVPSGFSVSGRPITGTGTLAVTTTLTGMVKGTGSGFTSATPGTDYLPVTTPKILGSGSGDICQFANSVGTVLSSIDSNGYGFVEKSTFLLALGTDLVTGTNVTNLGTIAGFNGKIVKCVCQANVNGASGGFSFTIKKNGTAIFSSAQSVAASTTTVQTYTTFSVTSVGAGDVFTVDVTAAGTGVQYVNVTLFSLVRNS